VFVYLFSQGGQFVGLMPVLAACHLIYVFSVVLHCISIHAVANKVLSLSVNDSTLLISIVFCTLATLEIIVRRQFFTQGRLHHWSLRANAPWKIL